MAQLAARGACDNLSAGRKQAKASQSGSWQWCGRSSQRHRVALKNTVHAPLRFVPTNALDVATRGKRNYPPVNSFLNSQFTMLILQFAIAHRLIPPKGYLRLQPFKAEVERLLSASAATTCCTPSASREGSESERSARFLGEGNLLDPPPRIRPNGSARPLPRCVRESCVT